MSTHRLLHVTLIAAMISVAGFSTAWSRMWKATPDSVARDYATINDTRPDGELVMLMWFVPEMVRPEVTGASILAPMLRKYTVITAVHGRLDKSTGRIAFDDINTLEANDQNGKPLALVAKTDLPPTTAAMVTALETMFRQSIGALGTGMKTFVFDSGDVDSCKNGKMSVPLAGETYTWQTPIPGCS